MLEKLKDSVPEGKFVSIECDLQDFSSVRKAAEEIKGRYSKIYCLSNNAGIMATPDRATVDGYDTQMQTNHLSHFLLTAELYPLLSAEAKENGDARIVNHSSGTRHRTPNGLEEKYFRTNGGNLGGDGMRFMAGACFERYFQTKLANSVFTQALHEKLEKEKSPVRVFCAHPGVSMTSLADTLDFGIFRNAMLNIVGPFIFQSPEDGTMGLLKCMMDPDAEPAVVWGPEVGSKGLPKKNPLKPYETDRDAAKLLWETSEDATGVKFSI